MRTTLTLDDDLAMMLKQKAEETGRPFRDVVNSAIRDGLDVEAIPQRLPDLPQPRSLGTPLVDIEYAIEYLDSLEDEQLIREMRGEK